MPSTTTPKPSMYDEKRAAYARYLKVNSVNAENYKRYHGARLSDFPAKLRFTVVKHTKTGFFLSGPTGVGKTRLLHAHYTTLPRLVKPTANEGFFESYKLPGRGDKLFISHVNLLMEIRDAFSAKSTISEKVLVKRFCDIEYLYIDDLGAEKMTEWGLQTLYLIIDGRNTNMKPTYISSNLSISEIGECYSPRIMSRISEACYQINMQGADKRLKRSPK
jgi:DNA replication protein DnaC